MKKPPCIPGNIFSYWLIYGHFTEGLGGWIYPQPSKSGK